MQSGWQRTDCKSTAVLKVETGCGGAPSISALARERKMGFWEFEASLAYIVRSGTAGASETILKTNKS